MEPLQFNYNDISTILRIERVLRSGLLLQEHVYVHIPHFLTTTSGKRCICIHNKGLFNIRRSSNHRHGLGAAWPVVGHVLMLLKFQLKIQHFLSNSYELELQYHFLALWGKSCRDGRSLSIFFSSAEITSPTESLYGMSTQRDSG